MKTIEDFERYCRQISMPEIGLRGQKRIAAAKVLVVGAGGISATCLSYLAAAGVGEIGIVDFDKIELSNLQRQILYSEESVGKSKITVAQEKLKKLNRSVGINIFAKKITAENVRDILKNYHIVVDCCDNFETRYIINAACYAMKIPFVYGSAEKFIGEVSFFLPEKGPCYRCYLPEVPMQTQTCATAGVLGAVTGIVGCLQAAEVIKFIVGKGKLLMGELLHFDIFNFRFRRYAFTKGKDCFCACDTL